MAVLSQGFPPLAFLVKLEGWGVCVGGSEQWHAAKNKWVYKEITPDFSGPE